LTHALRVTDGSDAFRALFAAVASEGERAGWLDLDAGEVSSGTVDDPPAWKAVAIEGRRTVAVKTRRGPPVLRDLLREHFRGCRVVLVRGGASLPTLRPRGADWELEAVDGGVRRLTTAELLRALRSPHLGA
jgi:hypothetical protein